jgi:hypothetical protein
MAGIGRAHCSAARLFLFAARIRAKQRMSEIDDVEETG